MSRAARWGAGELAHVRAGVQGAGAGRGARPRVLTPASITPGNSIASECWGDGVGPAREEHGCAERHWVDTAALSPHPTTSPWGPCTPVLPAPPLSMLGQKQSLLMQAREPRHGQGATMFLVETQPWPPG